MSSPSATTIRILPPLIAERIAAGETIERPMNVVKELVENSLDAGATLIEVTLEQGGQQLIQVTDNGTGMSPEDLSLCIARHATSKLTTLEDLQSMSTLGFRGEALASISAVAEVTLTSQSKVPLLDHDASPSSPPLANATYQLRVGDLATRFAQSLVPEKTTRGHFLHSPHGSEIQVQGLFSQIPARLRFLKSPSSEVAQVRDCLEKLALAYPAVGFKLVSNDRVLFDLAASDLATRMRIVLAESEDFPIRSATFTPEDARDRGLAMTLHWIQGYHTSHTRKIIQVVNLRVVKDRLLQQALLLPFKQSLLPGHFPVLFLDLTINPAAIDVNVHPHKTEIRFLNSQKIFQALDQLVRQLLRQQFVGHPHHPTTTTPPTFSPAIAQQDDESWSSASSSSPSSRAAPSPVPWTTRLAQESPRWQQQPLVEGPPPASSLFLPDESATEPVTGLPSQNQAPHAPVATHASIFGSTPRTTPRSHVLTNTHTPPPPPPPFRPPFLAGSNQTWARPQLPSDWLRNARWIGSVFQTYLLYEKAGQLILIDQHAAHERIRYECLKKRFLAGAPPLADGSASSWIAPSQRLLVPETLHFKSEQLAAVTQAVRWFNQLGFEASHLTGLLSISSIPAEWGDFQVKPRLKSLLERMLLQQERAEDAHAQAAASAGEEAQPPSSAGGDAPERSAENLPGNIPENLPENLMDELLFEKLASEACHSSVRSGDVLHELSQLALTDQLFLCDHPWNCPHGRPTVIQIPEEKLELWFQRTL